MYSDASYNLFQITKRSKSGVVRERVSSLSLSLSTKSELVQVTQRVAAPPSLPLAPVPLSLSGYRISERVNARDSEFRRLT